MFPTQRKKNVRALIKRASMSNFTQVSELCSVVDNHARGFNLELEVDGVRVPFESEGQNSVCRQLWIAWATRDRPYDRV